MNLEEATDRIDAVDVTGAAKVGEGKASFGTNAALDQIGASDAIEKVFA